MSFCIHRAWKKCPNGKEQFSEPPLVSVDKQQRSWGEATYSSRSKQEIKGKKKPATPYSCAGTTHCAVQQAIASSPSHGKFNRTVLLFFVWRGEVKWTKLLELLKFPFALFTHLENTLNC